VVKIKNVLYN
jgi:hypothetical protein